MLKSVSFLEMNLAVLYKGEGEAHKVEYIPSNFVDWQIILGIALAIKGSFFFI